MAETTVTYDILARDRASATFSKIGRSTTALERSMGRLSRTARVALGGFAAFEAVRAVKAIASIGIAYQDSLNTFQAVTRATVGQMDQVAQKAKVLGANLKLPTTSAADAAAAMTELAKGGLSVRQSMQAALGTLQLATAAQVDGAQAAKIQSAALAQFGLAGKQAGHVADLLANAANAAQGEITDMATALTYVGPVASKIGISIDDTTTAITLLAKNGILAQKAGTGLRGMIVSLEKPTTAGKDALKALGVQAFDSQGNFVGLRKVLDELHTAQGKFTKEGFANALATTFGKQNLSAITALASEGATAFDKYGKKLSDVNGVERISAAQSKGLGGALRGLQSQLETLAISIYQKVAPGIERVVRSLSERLPEFVNRLKAAFKRMRPDLEEFGRNFRKFVIAVGNALKSLRPLAKFVGEVIVGAFRTLSKVLGKLGDSGSTVKALTKLVIIGAAAWKGYAYWAKASAIWSARAGEAKVAGGGGGAAGAAKNGGIFGAVAAGVQGLIRTARAARLAGEAWLGLGRAVTLSGAGIFAASQDTSSATQVQSQAVTIATSDYLNLTKRIKTATGAERAALVARRNGIESFLEANHITTINGHILENLAGTLGGLPGLYAAAASGARDFAAALGGGGVPKTPFLDPGHPGYVPPSVGGKTSKGSVGNKGGGTSGTQSYSYDAGKSAGNSLAAGLKSAESKVISAARSLVDKIDQQFKDLKAKARDLAKSIADAMRGTADLSNLSQTDSLGAAMAPTISSITNFLHDTLKNDRQFRRTLKQLHHRGLSDALYRQFAQGGPAQFGAVVTALSGASRADLKDISQTNRQIGALGQSFGSNVAQEKYGAAIRAAAKDQKEATALLRQLVRAAHDDSITAHDAHLLGRQFRHSIQGLNVVTDTGKQDRKQGIRVVTS